MLELTKRRWVFRMTLLLLIGAFALGCSALSETQQQATNDALSDSANELDDDTVESANGSERSNLTLETIQKRGPHTVSQRTVTFVDPDRTTPGHPGEPAQPQRELTCEVWSPDPPIEGSPVVIHAHGFLSSRLDSHGLAQLLASHGAVVVAPDFPMTRRGLPGPPIILDALEQGGDIVFLMRALKNLRDDGATPWAAEIDPERWFVTGVSLGAYAALMAGRGNWPELTPPQGIVAMAPACCFLHPSDLEQSIPLLIIHGSADAILPIEQHGDPLFQAVEPPVWMLSLKGGTHTGCVDATAALFNDLPHADEIGCSALEGRIERPEDLLAELGDPGARLSSCPIPCQASDTSQTAMGTLRQVDLMYGGIMAFWRMTMRSDQGAAAFLEQGLASEASDVEVRVRDARGLRP